MEAARRLGEAQQNIEDRSQYRAALRLNWRLWTIIQSDVASPESPLSMDLRQNILSLSVFIDRHTVAALGEPDAQKLNVLIEINKNLAMGLLESIDREAKAGGEDPAAGAPAPAAPTETPQGGGGGFVA